MDFICIKEIRDTGGSVLFVVGEEYVIKPAVRGQFYTKDEFGCIREFDDKSKEEYFKPKEELPWL